MAIDEAELHNVNSNGVAVDGSGRFYHLGGEILTAPSLEPDGPATQMHEIKSRWPETTVTFRTGLNIHVRVPGLRDDLKKLKTLQKFIHSTMPTLLPVIDPVFVPTQSALPHPDHFAGAKRDHLRQRKNHHSFLPAWRLALQMRATTPQEFFEAEAIHPATGKVHWAIVLRACVNLRQLLQTDTVEFRHFAGSADPIEIHNATLWCKMFLEAAFGGGSTNALLAYGRTAYVKAWPRCLPYDPWLDEGYFFTSRANNPADQISANIESWLRNKRGLRHDCYNEPEG